MRRVALAILSTIAGLVLLLTFKTQTMSTSAIASPPAAIGSSDSVSSGTSSTGSSSSSSSTSGSSSSSSSSASKTVTGDSVDTRWGPVQVKITVSGGKITAVEAVDYPQNNGRDQEINSYAIPELNAEAKSASSAGIDTISGATYTSEGYIGSLQSALDKAGI